MNQTRPAMVAAVLARIEKHLKTNIYLHLHLTFIKHDADAETECDSCAIVEHEEEDYYSWIWMGEDCKFFVRVPFDWQ